MNIESQGGEYKIKRWDISITSSFSGKREPFTRKYPKAGRNESCPCGSRKKSKKCCGVQS